MIIRCMGGGTDEQQRKNRKAERDVQVCDADQSLGDTQGGREGKKDGKVDKPTHTERDGVCVCGATEGVRPVKRKGSDQSRDEAM